MSDSTHQANVDNGANLLDSLNRLSKKAGVQATFILERSSGAIIKSTGSLVASRPSTSNGTITASQDNANSTAKEHNGIEEMAAMSWAYVNTTQTLIQGLDAEDQVKLSRLRTKRYELVIVPDAKYLLVVVHEMPTS